MLTLMRRPYCLGLIAIALLAAPALALEPTAEELARSRAWAQAKFAGAIPARPSAVGLLVQRNYGPVQLNSRDGKPLKIGDVQFSHGLFCHANSRIRLGLPGPAETFSAQVGIDTNGTWYGGTVVFSVIAGGKVVCKTDMCSRGEAPRHLQADLGGASELTLVVSDAGDNINSDQADWADAIVTLADGKEIWIGDLPLLPGGDVELTADPPFSFQYAGQAFSEIGRTWKVSRTSRPLDAARTEHVVTWTDPATRLSVRCIAIEYTDFPTIEWTLHFKNNGTTDTPIIESIQPVDTLFGSQAQADGTLRYHTGDMCTADSYAPHADPMPAGSEKKIANVGGRPTQNAFPYFNLGWPDDGVIVVLSWAGQWAAQFTRNDTMEIRVCGGQELTHFTLHPGEEVRSPMVVVQFYKGDWLRGQNIWRQWMVEHNLPRPNGKLVQPMASLCTGNYYPGLMSNATQELLFLRTHVEQGIRFDAWWQDAGWYPCDGVTWPKTGTWEVDTGRFPNGLREVGDYVHSQGAKSIVWFEPERVHAGTWLAEHHPEWVHGGKDGGLLKLGDPACRQWLTDHIDRLLTEQGIDIYRQDFNIDPLAYWRAADTEDRQGITEIRHVEGYFAYWDELLRRHPGMFIDSCASGGRRNDLETLRRAVPLLRSDWYNAPDGQQCHTYALSLWFPYQGTAGYLYRFMNGQYWIRSAMVAEFTFGPDAAGLDGVDWSMLKTTMNEWRQINDCFYGDFYPITPYSLTADVWMAWQYDQPAMGKGVVQVFRRGESIYESARLPLRGLDPEATYVVSDLDTKASTQMRGRDLTEEGLPVMLRSRPGSAILLYQRSQPHE
ncbi:MAG: NPCBM/NEW2 domain-containing protein [Phycisphaerae bacterium]|nr:NPCBM/NEW2 domain-containing protein [Phycisphaerae bacterium]